LATYSLLPSGLIAIPLGFEKTVIVAATVLVAVLITETEAEVPLITYTLLLSGLTTIPRGVPPTGIVATTVLVAVLITETLFPSKLTTYTRLASGLTAIQAGLKPTGIVATTACVAVLITETVPSMALPTYAYNDVCEWGVTVIVAVITLVPVFTVVKGAILPIPLAGKPMPGVLLTQLSWPVPVKLIAAVVAPFIKV